MVVGPDAGLEIVTGSRTGALAKYGTIGRQKKNARSV
jgi:hypothetical protein